MGRVRCLIASMQLSMLLSAILSSTLDDAMAQEPKGMVYSPVDFVIPVGPVFRNVNAEIHSPSGHVTKPEIVDNGDESVTIKFQPTETGVHQLHVSYNRIPIEGSPYDFFVEATNG